MPHGTPDWAEMAPRSTVYSGIDLTELAARLDSIVTFDRRGDVVWIDDFESGIGKWQLVRNNLAGARASSAEYARSGAFSCKITAGDAATNWAGIQHYGPRPVLSKVGFEFSFSFYEETDRIRMEMEVYDGEYWVDSLIQFNPQAYTLEYLGSDNNLHEFATGVYRRDYLWLFHTAKVVVDFTTRKYVRFILDDAEYDLSAHAAYSILNAASPVVYYLIDHRIDGVSYPDMYVDDVIITQNEP